MLTEAVARKLYELWCYDGGHFPTPPDWSAFDSGAVLNGEHGSLRAEHFRGEAERIAPFDNVEALAHRMCLDNGIAECVRCTHETCIGWTDWIDDAKAVLSVASAY